MTDELEGPDVLAACGLLLAASGWALMPRDKVFYGAMSSAFAVLLVIFIMLPRIGLALRRFARHMVSITAGKLMRPVAARGPYKIVYELSGTSLVTRAEAVQVSSTLDLRKVRVAIETPDFICAFPSRFAQRPIRVLYLPGPSEHAAMRAALVASGAEMLRVPPGV